MEERIFVVESSDVNKRLDAYLTECIDGFSRSYMQKLIEDKNVKVNDREVKANYRLKDNDRVEISIPDPEPLEVKAEKIDLDIVYEDDDIIVINKPQGMVVHPAHGNYTGTVVNALLDHCDNLSGINGVMRPGIVHRIDKDTSGIIVIAKTNEAHISLSEQLKEHTINRRYIALLEGVIKVDNGTVNAPIGRSTSDRKKMAVTDKNSKHAITHFTVLERFNKHTLIEARLETGRTHQIRVHMSYIGHPVVGDTVYGFKKQQFSTKGQLLHARLLGFIHPRTGQYVEFEAPIPDYFENILRIIREKQ
jgi:23S rRNA pseudouridine1911/1915/1917 synthase